jgi:DHA3 family tetracycline resistance protein-like MFS transporter
MKRPNAYAVYLILTGASELFFWTIFTMDGVYQVTMAQLNPLQLVLVGTVLEFTCFLFEVPTGIVADVYSRKLSVVIGMALIGSGFMLEGLFPHFELILLAQVVWGVGATFTSGATEAWITDEIGEEKAGRAFLRGSQVGQVCTLVGIVAGMMLANIRLNLPIVLGGGLFGALGLVLWLIMPENGFTPTPTQDRNSWQRMAHTFRGGLAMMRVRPALITILVIGSIYGAFSEGLDRLWTPHLLAFNLPALDGFQPVVWFGVVRIAGMLLAIGATEVARRRVDTNSHAMVARVLSINNALLIACVVVFGLAGHWGVAFAAFMATMPLRWVRNPLYTAWVNQRLDPQVRATVISMSSQADALGQVIGGPILGAIATGASLRAALVVAGLALLPSLLLYARTIRQDAAQQQVKATSL